jgi:hypothetical protein
MKKMNKEQEKVWVEACEHEEKAKGYVSAELLMLPMFIDMAKEGKIEIGGSEDFMVIGSKGTLSKHKKKER